MTTEYYNTYERLRSWLWYYRCNFCYGKGIVFHFGKEYGCGECKCSGIKDNRASRLLDELGNVSVNYNVTYRERKPNYSLDFIYE